MLVRWSNNSIVQKITRIQYIQLRPLCKVIRIDMWFSSSKYSTLFDMGVENCAPPHWRYPSLSFYYLTAVLEPRLALKLTALQREAAESEAAFIQVQSSQPCALHCFSQMELAVLTREDSFKSLTPARELSFFRSFFIASNHGSFVLHIPSSYTLHNRSCPPCSSRNNHAHESPP